MQSDKSLIERMFPAFLCLLCRDSDDRHQKTNLIRMMKETKIQPQVTFTIAGNDGEAMGKSEENAKNKQEKEIEKPADAGWYVAVVRVNCEKRIAESIRLNLNTADKWFEYWIPMVKVAYVDKRSLKRKVKEKLFLSTFIFCNVSPSQLDEIRFRSDVYKMLTMPGDRKIYRIPDEVIANYRNFVENDEEPVTAAPVPLRKGIKVRVVAGSMKGVEAYVQCYNGKKATIGSEIKYISGATLTISRDLLEIIDEK